ncbi:MAG: hypothetical protein QOG03_326 [Actinomycetota bacterium]|jgi:GT2 family glycosyltransferase|nr:hypothetical protein [Actinomycetota bacterium]
MTPFVRVVVLNFNGGDLTTDCLTHLEQVDWPADRLELVMVDNSPADGVAERVRRDHPTVRIVTAPRNLGFAGGNDLALRDLGAADYVALLNNDATIEPGWLRPLVAALEADPSLAAANSKIVFAAEFVEVELSTSGFTPGRGDPRDLGVRLSGVRVDGTDQWRDTQRAEGWWGIEHGGPDEVTFEWSKSSAVLRVPVTVGDDRSASRRVELKLAAEREKSVTIGSGDESVSVTVGPTPAWHEIPLGGKAFDVINNVGSVLIEGGWGADRGYLEPDRGQYDEAAEVFAWCGGSVLLRRKYLDEVGVFDERFFLYYEDFDLSWRGRLAGWRYQYVPESRVRHIHSASSGEASAIFQHHVERNRLLMLTKNAPAWLARQAAFRFVLSTASYGRRDVVSPVLRGHRPNTTLTARRVRSFVDYLRLLPHALRERRRVRAHQVVPDEQLLSWAVPPRS